QNGLAEAIHQTATFTIIEDVTPPVTTSNAQTTYYWYNASITLTATDASTHGVKATYYSLDGGPTQTGTFVNVPAVDGVVPHTLTFWSEDWTGNAESPNTVNFTIIRQTGTIRLVWGNSDIEGEPGPAADESASWTVRLGGATGGIVATGSATGESWTGVNDIVVPVRATPYYVRVDYEYWEYLGAAWGWELIPDSTIFPSVPVTEADAVIRLSY
ncbi:MAG: OmpL47-type beta-barrel domain-containing protein, partial [Thiobacillus sp.]